MDKKVDTIIGGAALGCILAGNVSLIGALFPLFNGDFMAAGLLLLAAGLSFGSLTIAFVKK